MVPPSAASMEKGAEATEPPMPKFGGSIRVNGEAVRRRLRIPTRCFLVGERPAGADSDDMVVLMVDVLDLEAGDRGRTLEAGDRG